MKTPVSVEIDVPHQNALIRFREPHRDEILGTELLEDPNGDDFDVAVERGCFDEIVGIELLNFDPRVVAAAETFARANGLRFPAEAFAQFTAALAGRKALA